jgi:N,N'-diacetyllegionaminate synthase
MMIMGDKNSEKMKNYFETLNKCLLIAEIGVNHNGDMNTAMKLIEKAKEAGADVVKFQTFTAKNLVTLDAPKVEYQLRNSDRNESHYEMLRKLELTHNQHVLLKNYCEEISIEFASTPYDIDSARFLHENLDVKFFKTASADIVDLPLHRYIAKTKKPTIVAVGMATLGEIERVCEIYRQEENSNLILLHCVSNYPCSDASINMKVLRTLQTAFNLPVGYSDHSEGDVAATISISLGARVIEKHFTLSRDATGPDHKASDTPEQFAQLVKNVRRAEEILGSSQKKRQKEETRMAEISRKSIHMAKTIEAGEDFNEEHLMLKRPGTGILALEIDNILGKRARKKIQEGAQLKYTDFE